MAIDTAAKRASCTGVSRPWMRGHYAGTINEAWRIAAGNAYGGNTLSGGGGGPPEVPPGLAKKISRSVGAQSICDGIAGARNRRQLRRRRK